MWLSPGQWPGKSVDCWLLTVSMPTLSFFGGGQQDSWNLDEWNLKRALRSCSTSALGLAMVVVVG